MSKCLTENDYDKSIENVLYKLNIAFAIVLVTFGSFGNTFTFYIYSRSSFKRTSTGFYFSCLAIVNTSALIIFVSRFFYDGIYKDDISSVSDFTCKFFSIALYLFPPLSAWIETAASLDRLAATKFTPLFSSIKRRRFQVLIVGLIFLILMGVNVPNMIYFQLIDKSNTNKTCKVCGIQNNSPYNLYVLNLLDLFITILIPFILMVMSSLKISLKVFQTKVKVVNIKNTKLNLNKEYQFAATIIGRNILFLLLNLPATVLLIVDIHCDLYTFNTKNIHYDLVYAVASFFSYFNYSNTFIIDIVCNRMFRKRFIQIFSKKTVVNESIKL